MRKVISYILLVLTVALFVLFLAVTFGCFCYMIA